MTRSLLVSFMAFLTGALIGCASESIQSKQGSILVEYRGDCLVACGSYILNISDTGQIRYNAKDSVAAKRHPKSRLSESDLDRIRQKVDDIEYFNRQELDCGELLEDSPSFWITVNSGNRSRRVQRHYGCSDHQGDPVFDLLRSIEEIVGLG